MITKEALKECINEYLNQNDLFLVEISISKENDIEIIVEKKSGSVKIENCIDIDGIVSSAFDRETEDYSLTVSSAGLDQPFKVPEQYEKFLGEEVEVTILKGSRTKGILSSCSDEGIEITTSKMVKKEGEKKKVEEKSVTPFKFSEIKGCKPVIKFK